MGKVKNITPTIAKILAEKIVAKIKESYEHSADKVDHLNKLVNDSAEVKEGMKIMKQLEVLNKKIMNKIKSEITGSYADCKYFGILGKAENRSWISQYWLKEYKKVPNVDIIKNEILMESFFNEGVSPDDIIAQYVTKYTKTK